MQGPHLFESIDQALYRRLGLPDWLIASEEESYIKSALRLIGDEDLRHQLTAQFGTIDSVQALHQGQDSQLSAKLLAKISYSLHRWVSSPLPLGGCSWFRVAPVRDSLLAGACSGLPAQPWHLAFPCQGLAVQRLRLTSKSALAGLSHWGLGWGKGCYHPKPQAETALWRPTRSSCPPSAPR